MVWYNLSGMAKEPTVDMPRTVELDNLTKNFREEKSGATVRAVDGVTATVKPGELVTLLGPSGCGKTTILRMIAGFEKPTAGRVFIDGHNVTGQPPERRDVGMVFQNYALFPHMTVWENLDFVLALRGMESVAKARKIREFLAMVGLEGKGNRAPHELSGGQQQRVALARALINNPSVLLLDEPLSNLDAILREQMRVEIKKIQKSLGMTAIYVTHARTEAMSLSDRIIVMNSGQIIQIGTPLEIYADPVSMYVASLIGKTAFFTATVHSVGDTCNVVINGRILSIPRWSDDIAPGREVVVMCRPESLALSSPAAGTLKGRVITSMYLGDTLETYVSTYEGEIMVQIPNPAGECIYGAGEAVGIIIQPEFAKVLPPEEGE